MKNKNYKHIIALDMDETLLDSEKKISKETVEYLKSLKDRGYMIVLASGRPYRAVIDYYNQLELDSPLVCYNGALVLNPKQEDYPKTCYKFNPQTIKQIISDCGEKCYNNVFLENDTDLYCAKEDKNYFTWLHFDNMNVHYGKIKEILDKPCYVCLININKDDYNCKDRIIEATFKHEKLGVRCWGDETCFAELYYLGVNKYSAIESIRKYYEIDEDNVICFGDTYNDIEMLREYKYSVLMKNSQHLTSQHTSFISVEDNNHDGVKETLEKIIIPLFEKNNKAKGEKLENNLD